jgi:uncharacterized protein YjbK
MLGDEKMAQEIEIEFKNMLTKEQYEQLLVTFAINKADIKHQVNHYFDTPDWHLKNLSSGLRVRIVDHQHYECTLKQKTSTHTHLETTDILSKAQAHTILQTNFSDAPSVRQQLVQLEIPLEALNLFGSLATNRVELNYKGGTLVFDHSHYVDTDDYEVEYETTNEQEGAQIFEAFLQQHNIKKHGAMKKIARFMNALQQKG